MRTTRTLAATLAMVALAVPAAQARPADGASAARAQSKQGSTVDAHHAALAHHAAARTEDLRHLRAANGGTYMPRTPGATHSSGATAGGQYTPGVDAERSQPSPATPAPALGDRADNGVSPAAIGLGIAGGLLALAGALGVTRRSRRVQRAHLTA
jgi:hypothetical protein